MKVRNTCTVGKECWIRVINIFNDISRKHKDVRQTSSSISQHMHSIYEMYKSLWIHENNALDGFDVFQQDGEIVATVCGLCYWAGGSGLPSIRCTTKMWNNGLAKYVDSETTISVSLKYSLSLYLTRSRGGPVQNFKLKCVNDSCWVAQRTS